MSRSSCLFSILAFVLWLFELGRRRRDRPALALGQAVPHLPVRAKRRGSERKISGSVLRVEGFFLFLFVGRRALVPRWLLCLVWAHRVSTFAQRGREANPKRLPRDIRRLVCPIGFVFILGRVALWRGEDPMRSGGHPDTSSVSRGMAGHPSTTTAPR